MRTPKTLSDLPRWLGDQFDLLHHLDTFGLPDHGDFDGFEAAAIINECQRVACGFGAPLVCDEQHFTSVRAGMELVGKLLAWAREQTASPSPLTIQQAAEHLGISSEKLYRLVAQGEIRHYRVGRAIRFTPEHLDAYQREMTEAARYRQSESERPDRL